MVMYPDSEMKTFLNLKKRDVVNFTTKVFLYLHFPSGHTGIPKMHI